MIEVPLSKPQQEIFFSEADINLFLAGMGSGKTYLGGIISAYLVLNYPQVKGFIGANTYDQLNTSTLYRIKAVWNEVFKMTEGRHYVCGVKPLDAWPKPGHYFDSYNNIISFANGAIIFQGSLENAKSHEGKEFGWAILDETKDTREEDVKEVILMRLREKGIDINGRPWNPLYILTSPSKVPWINEWFKLDEYEGEIRGAIYSTTDYFHKKYDNKAVCISSTYHNQEHLPPNYIEGKRFDLTTEQFNRVIYGDPFMKTGGEFYSSFDRSIHVKPTPPIEGPVHISFDQNVVPYITANLYQIVKEEGIYHVRCFDEFCLPNPNNKTEKLCQAIIQSHGALLENGLYFYGDASGKHRDTRGLENDYDIIERVFHRYLSNSSNRVLHKNPSLNKRRMFLNRIFEDKLPIRIQIDPKCKNLIIDLEYIKETPEGTKLKQTVRDDKMGASYEKYGHCFVAGTIIDGQKPIEYFRVGDITEFGRVQNCWDNGIREVRTYQVGDLKLTCTPDHKIFVLSDEIDYICIGEMVNKYQKVNIKINGQWKEKQLFTKDLNSIAIQTLKNWQTKDILRAGLKSEINKLKHIYTDLFGSGIMVRFLPAFIFIMLTVILTITTLAISFVLKAVNIFRSIVRTQAKRLKLFVLRPFMKIGIRHQNGTGAMRGGDGIANITTSQSKEMKRQYAKSAARHTEKKYPDHHSAPRGAKIDIVQPRQGIDIRHRKPLFVKYAEQFLNQSRITLADFAAVNVIKSHARVYNLNIEYNHVYNANGLLVHNCSDDLDYFILSAFNSFT